VVAVFATIFRGGVPRERLESRDQVADLGAGRHPTGIGDFWHPESVVDVGLAEFDASALYRNHQAVARLHDAVGSGVTPWSGAGIPRRDGRTEVGIALLACDVETMRPTA